MLYLFMDVNCHLLKKKKFPLLPCCNFGTDIDKVREREREREIYFAIHSLHNITKNIKKGKNSSKQMARKHRLTARFSNQDAP